MCTELEQFYEATSKQDYLPTDYVYRIGTILWSNFQTGLYSYRFIHTVCSTTALRRPLTFVGNLNFRLERQTDSLFNYLVTQLVAQLWIKNSLSLLKNIYDSANI